MLKGIVLCQGDKTTCGGKIIAGSAHGVAFNKPQAKEGDPVTCGKDGKTYKIIGGIAFYTSGSENKRIAGSLDNYSSCPCKAKFLPANSYPVYIKEESSALPPTIANFSNIADKGIGLAADPVGKYFENIEKILKEIQETYKNTFRTRGALIGEQFYVRRAQLYNELDRVLKVGFLKKAMKFGQYSKIKNALGLSTSSITHKWNETGIGDIEGYAAHIERAAKYVKAMRYTDYVGIAFSAVHSVNEINEACSTGREDECTKKKYTEVGSFSGGIVGGIAGGALGTGICTLVFGFATIEVAGAGALVCGVLLGSGGGFIGGEYLSSKGETLGESIYETVGE